MTTSDEIKILRQAQGYLVLRAVLAGIIAAHGWARFITGGVVPFGGFLDAQGFPFGFWIAEAITLFEIVGSPILLFGRQVFLLSLGFSFIYLMGIILVHAPEGWFVVGLGRNGMEYSVLLIVCLIVVGLQYMPANWLNSSQTEPNE